LLSILPIDAVEPTPFQRDLSDAHHKRLADVINKTGRFLDPIIAVVAPKGGFWTPNGRHRLEAMRRLGAKSITALVVADREVAWQILALNTEKAHNLKERSLEVIRIYRGLVDEDATRPESQFAFYLDESALVTLGVCYERFPLTSLQQRLVKTGGRLVKHARYYWLLLAEGHLNRQRFRAMLGRIALLPVRAG
jgi:ParB family chromosome partitioning protein